MNPLPILSSCDDCGACCLVVTEPPFRRVFDGDGEEAWNTLKRAHPALVAEILTHQAARREAGVPSHGSPCLWYDPATRKCRHHPLRPQACRAFTIASPDCLDARRRAGIEASFLAAVVTLDEVDSTSTHAAQLARAGNTRLPFAVRAKRQTQGRGQRTNRWWSDEGSLTFTLALDPRASAIERDLEPRLALAAAVSVIRAVASLGHDTSSLGVRWPNDLEANGRKWGGILAESIETTHGRRILIGVGLNLSSSLGEAPIEVRNMAASLHTILGITLDPELIFDAVIRAISRALRQLAARDDALANDWARFDLLSSQYVHVEQPGRIIEGLARGIDPAGALVVETARGRERVVAGRVRR